MAYQSINSAIIIQLLLMIIIICQLCECDIRCYCNQPVCVRTGYMCKSKGQQAGCFVEHSAINFNHNNNDDGSGGGGGSSNVGSPISDISRHGCIEMLSNDQRITCLKLALSLRNNQYNRHSISINNQQQQHQQQYQSLSSILLRKQNKTITCCVDDMCNYVKTIIDDNITNDNNNQQQQEQYNNNHRHPYSQYTNIINLSNNNNNQRFGDDGKSFESLGKHLQESYSNQEINGSIKTIALIIVLPILLLSIIICSVILYIRKDDQKKMKHLYKNKHKTSATEVKKMMKNSNINNLNKDKHYLNIKNNPTTALPSIISSHYPITMINDDGDDNNENNLNDNTNETMFTSLPPPPPSSMHNYNTNDHIENQNEIYASTSISQHQYPIYDLRFSNIDYHHHQQQRQQPTIYRQA